MTDINKDIRATFLAFALNLSLQDGEIGGLDLEEAIAKIKALVVESTDKDVVFPPLDDYLKLLKDSREDRDPIYEAGFKAGLGEIRSIFE